MLSLYLLAASSHLSRVGLWLPGELGGYQIFHSRTPGKWRGVRNPLLQTLLLGVTSSIFGSAATAWSEEGSAPVAASEPTSGEDEEPTPRTASAWSGPRKRVVLFEISSSTPIPPALEARISAAVTAGFEAQQIYVIQPETVAWTLAPLGAPIAQSCRAGNCVSWILDTLEADVGIRVGVTAAESSYSVTVTIVGPLGEAFAQRSGHCDICTIEEFLSRLSEVSAQLAARIPRRVNQGLVSVSPNPADAEVVIDGVFVGRGTLYVPLPAGQHEVEARLLGFREARQQIMVNPDAWAHLRLSLEPGRARPLRTRQAVRLGPFLWTATGVGAALAVTGGILLGTHQRCDGPDATSSCDTQGSMGAGFLTGGLTAALVGGVGLFLFYFAGE